MLKARRRSGVGGLKDRKDGSCLGIQPGNRGREDPSGFPLYYSIRHCLVILYVSVS